MGKQIYFTNREIYALKRLLDDWEKRLKPEDETVWSNFLDEGYYNICEKVEKASKECPFYG